MSPQAGLVEELLCEYSKITSSIVQLRERLRCIEHTSADEISQLSTQHACLPEAQAIKKATKRIHQGLGSFEHSRRSSESTDAETIRPSLLLPMPLAREIAGSETLPASLLSGPLERCKTAELLEQRQSNTHIATRTAIQGTEFVRAAVVEWRTHGTPVHETQSDAMNDVDKYIPSGTTKPKIEQVAPLPARAVAEQRNAAVPPLGTANGGEQVLAEGITASTYPYSPWKRGTGATLSTDAALAMCCAADGRILVLQEHRVLVWEQAEATGVRWRHSLTLQGLPSDRFRSLHLLPPYVSTSYSAHIAATGEILHTQAQEQVHRNG